jgi:multiple sugar transport system permease protein
MIPSARLGETSTHRAEYLHRIAQSLNAYLFIAPALIILAVVAGYPWIVAARTSLEAYNPVLGINPHYVGLANYARVFRDPLFWTSSINTILLLVPALGLEMLLGTAIALLLNASPGWFSNLARTAILIPMMMAPSLAGLIWRLFISPDFGLLNYLLSLLSLPPLPWTASPRLSIPIVILVDVWQNTPFVVLILLAGLQSVPVELVEAARVDGTSALQLFWRVLTPCLRPFFVVALLFRSIYIIRTFDVILLLFGSIGGLGNSALLWGNYLYFQTYNVWDLGLSSAISIVMVLATCIWTFAYTRFIYHELTL